MAAKKIEKTNAARLLDRAKIPYTLIPYEVDEEDLSCTHVAAQLGEAIECVFKTLVLKGDRSGYFVCVVPGDHEVDLKAAARVSGNKKADLIPMKELLPVTGYIRGGCSPIGMKRAFPTYIHSSCLGLSESKHGGDFRDRIPHGVGAAARLVQRRTAHCDGVPERRRMAMPHDARSR